MSNDAPTPESQTPSLESESMADALDIVQDVEMNPTTGELEIKFKEESEDGDESDGDAATSADTPSEELATSDAEESSDSDTSFASSIEVAEKRYRDLQSHTDKQLTEAYGQIQELRENLARFEGRQEVSADRDSEPSTEDDSDDPYGYGDEDAAFARRLATEVDKRVKTTFDNLGIDAVQLKDALEDRQLLLELEATRAQFPDFDARGNQIKEVLSKDTEGKLSFTEAYEIAVALYPELPEAQPEPEPAAPAPPPQPPASDGDAERERLLKKQNRLGLSPESVRSDSDITRETEIASPKDAIRSAFEEVFSEA